jgi:hypothetical protein
MKIKNKSIKTPAAPIEKKLVKNKLVTSKPIKNKSVKNKPVTSNPTRGKLIKSKLNRSKLNRSKSIVSKLIKRKSRSASSYKTSKNKTKFANEDFFRMGACALTGFKKQVYRPVRAYNGRIQPSLNRRKHAHSHMMILDHQIRQLSKAFNYIKIKTIKFWSAQSMLINYANWYTLNPSNVASNLSSLVNFSSLPTRNLVKIIDMFPKSLVWKNTYSKSVIDVFTLHGKFV